MLDWRETSLGGEIELAYGKSLPAHARESGRFGVFGSNGLVGTHTEACVDGPGIVVGRKGSVGEVTYSADAFWPIDTTYYVVNKSDHNWRFLFHLLRHSNLTSLNSHSAIPGLNREDVYSVAVNFPSRKEENDIAYVLDCLESSIHLEVAALSNATELKQAAMHKIFTCGLRGEPQKETAIGPVPESWQVSTLGGICSYGNSSIQTGPFGSQLHSHEYRREGTPIINPIHLNGNKINHGNIPKVSPDTAVRLKRHKVKVGDILFARRGEIGRHGLVSPTEDGWLCGTGCFLVRVSYSMIDNVFLSYLFSTDAIVAWLNAHAAGAIMPNLNNLVLSNMPVVYPEDEYEQHEIVAILDAIDRKIDLHRRKKSVLEELFKAMLHKLMSGEIRVDDLDLSALHQQDSEEKL